MASTSQKAYKTLIGMFDRINWVYDKYDDKLLVETGMKSNDLKINFKIYIYEKYDELIVISKLPFTVSSMRREVMALAVCMINNSIRNGRFDYNINEGELSFRCSSCFTGGELSDKTAERMVMLTGGTVEDYNDKLYAINDGTMSLSELEKILNK